MNKIHTAQTHHARRRQDSQWLSRRLNGGFEDTLSMTMTELDRLHNQTGILRASLEADDELQPLLYQLQQELLDLNEILQSTAATSSSSSLCLLETLACTLELPSVDSAMVLPAGNRLSALAHTASKQCLRMERHIRDLTLMDNVHSRYLNSLPRLTVIYERLTLALAQRQGHPFQR